MSTGESWDVNRHTARCTSPVFVVWRCKNWYLVEGYGNGDQRRLIGLTAREGSTYLYNVDADDDAVRALRMGTPVRQSGKGTLNSIGSSPTATRSDDSSRGRHT